MTPIEVSAGSEGVISYALLTVGTSPTESPGMRHMAANVLREIGHELAAREVEESLHSVKT